MSLVVIGAEAAGLSAASQARRLDPRLDIVVLEKTAHISYGACGLPYYIEGQVRALSQLQVYSPEYFERERNIRIRTNAEAVSIAHPRREVVLSSGERVRYHSLIIATGARRNLSSIRGSDQPHVFQIDSWDQAGRLKTFLHSSRPKHAAIIGAGYIGIEAAEALRAQGLQVALYDRNADLLHRGDPWLTRLVTRHLERCRITVHLRTTLDAIPSCDLALLASGLKPNVTLAQDAGVELGRTGAIRVTDRMETNLNGVYAAGDCAESTHLVTGRAVWVPLGTTANKAGRIAGAAATGSRQRFPGIVGTSIVRVCGLALGMTGLSNAMAKAEGFDPISTEIEALEKPRYFRGRPCSVQLTADRQTGRLLGAAILGEDAVAGRINVVATALSERMLLEDFQHLDLAYAPPFSTVHDPLLIAAHQLVKLLH